MARPNWEYVRIDVLMPDHPKIEALSDKAFRALVTLWCYCGQQRTDGIVTAKRWNAWPAKVRAELVAAGLAHPLDLGGGAEMHDYLGHQRSRQEIEEESAKRAEIARNAANARWNRPRAVRLAMLGACSQHHASSIHRASPQHMHKRC